MRRLETITSPRNPLLKDVRRAASCGALTAGGLCVAEGFHLLEEALRSGLQTPVVLAAESVRGVVERHVGRLRNVRLLAVADGVFAQISATESAQGVMALVQPPKWELEQVFRERALVVVLDGVQDPGNAGAIARAAEAFGATGMLWLKGSVSLWNAKTVRASAGSLFRLPVVDGMDSGVARAALRQHRLDVYTAAPHTGLAAPAADLQRRCALVIGNEGHGASKDMSGAGVDIHIPTSGVESLNASVAAAILLYEAWRQRASV